MTDTPRKDALAPGRPSSRLRVAIAWLIVGLPAAWGITQTAIQATALFRSQALVSSAPTSTAAPATVPSSTRP